MSEDYYKNLPKKRMAVGALFFNTSSDLLIVKPTYKAWWSIPGGVIEKEESPRSACIREIKEEIGLDVQRLDLLCVDWTSPMPGRGDALQLIFHAGILRADEIESIKLADDEISEYRFVPVEEAIVMLSDKLQRRIRKCLDALKSNSTFYLEDGLLTPETGDS
ncbi:MAG: NUDIX hydrolase [Candidatus Obscuribacterales bacterium]|nr:NUDIX hydrolase [Candidatus Obscuribacterales bacterium]